MEIGEEQGPRVLPGQGLLSGCDVCLGCRSRPSGADGERNVSNELAYRRADFARSGLASAGPIPARRRVLAGIRAQALVGVIARIAQFPSSERHGGCGGAETSARRRSVSR
jgi:hypothetical protein